MRGQIGVCSWSLNPASPADLVGRVLAAGCRAVQLALDPIRRGEWDEQETFERLGEAGIAVPSGMMAMAGEDYSTINSIRRTGGVRPDATWPANREAAERLAEIAARRGIGLVTFHAGFIPPDPDDPERGRMVDRLADLAGVFADAGVRVALETGQEDADTLADLLAMLDGLGHEVGVNFDPANMLLYGSGDPIEALDRLTPRVFQIHIKDARPPALPGVWGTETPVGRGAVDWGAFFGIVRGRLTGVDLMIEREAGDERISEIAAAREFVESHLTGEGSAGEGSA